MTSDRDPALTATETSGEPLTVEPTTRSMLGRYKLERVLGVGGMGVVHAAIDIDLERKVAIKILHGDPAHGSRARLLREARAMARLDHPNVVKIYEVDSIEGTDFVVMELVNGGSLLEWLRSAPRTTREIIDAFLAAGRGLAAAHADGMVHRDFKPANVLRSKSGGIKVGDFGLARDADDSTPPPIAEPSASTSTLVPARLAGITHTGALVGTPAYMAPEQWAAGTISPAADQFAFCVALWEALAGERPFQGNTDQQLRLAIEAGTDKLDVAKIPRAYRGALLRGLAQDPAQRWPSMNALLGELAPRSQRWLWIGLAVAVVVAALIAAALVHDPAPPPAPPHRAILPKPQHEVVASVTKLGDEHFRMPRAIADQVLLEAVQLTEAVKAVPSKRGDVVIGFKLFAVHPDSLAAALGLRNFDLVTGLDELAFDTDAHLAAAAAEVHSAPAVQLHYLRAGQPRTIVVDLTP